MVKVAAIDCGSNSTRLLIARPINGKLEALYRHNEVTRLSNRSRQTNVILPDSKKRFYNVLKKYIKKIRDYKVQEVFCIGTAVFRNSENSENIVDEVKKRFNLEIKIISSREEGLLTALGVQSSFNNLENYLIVDIGGQSTELIYDLENKIKVISNDIGVVSLNENYLDTNPLRDSLEIDANKYFEKIFTQFDFTKRDLIGVSGTFTTLASIFLNQKRYNEEEIDKIQIDIKSVNKIYDKVKLLSEAQIITHYPSLDPKRAKTITSGIFMVKNILKKYEINQLKVSKSDILEGLILKYF